jgi:hypothetical protein
VEPSPRAMVGALLELEHRAKVGGLIDGLISGTSR